MHFHSLISATIATLSLAVGTNAWAQAADGTWVANNNVYRLDYTGGIDTRPVS